MKDDNMKSNNPKGSTMNTTKIILTLMVVATLAACATSMNSKSGGRQVAASNTQVSSIASLDVPHYMGQWYEIGRLPMFFQRKCAKNTTANYRLQDDGNVEVTNRCTTASGDSIKATGLARKTDQPAQLKVSFAPNWVQSLPMIGNLAQANYWVLKLDDGYQHALVGTPDRKYLWLLSRDKTMPKDIYQNYLQAATAQGYDLAKWQTTPHD